MLHGARIQLTLGLAIALVGLALVLPPFAEGVVRDGSPPEARPPQPVSAADATKVAMARETCAAAQPEALQDCYLNMLQSVLRRDGAREAFSILEGIIQGDAEAAQFGHPLAHDLGRIAFEHHASAEEAFLACPPNLASGCYHGVLEAFLRNLGKSPVHEALTTICGGAIVRAQGEFGRFQCLHGLGHGIMMTQSHNLTRSLALCGLFSTQWARESCDGGVFMENIVSVTGTQDFRGSNNHTGHHMHSRGTLRADDPLYPCNQVESQHQAPCYLLQTSAILYLNGQDFERAFETCDAAPQEYVSLCYASMGRDISGTANHDAIQTIALCSLGDVTRRGDCIYGAVKDFMNAHARADPGFRLCWTTASSEKPQCYAGIGEMLRILVPGEAERKEECQREAEAAFIDICLQGRL